MDLMRFVASVIKASLGIDIKGVLIFLSGDHLMDVVGFADDAIVEARRQVMIEQWANPNSNLRKSSKRGWAEDGAHRVASKRGWAEDGAHRVASKGVWAVCGVH
jgi:hypothetical protein